MGNKQERIQWGEQYGSPDAKNLVLLLHGLDSSPNTIEQLCHVIQENIPSSFTVVPELPFQWYRSIDLREISRDILEQLDDIVDISTFQTIQIIGHSAGGLLAQSIYLISRGETYSLSSVAPAHIRLVLIAPLNRGWQLSHHLPLTHKISWSTGFVFFLLIAGIGKLQEFLHLGKARIPWIMQIHRGSPFLVWLRLTWLEQDKNKPVVFQLLGSIDEIVSWRDMVDKVTGEDFVHLEVPYSDHMSIIDFEDASHGKKRAEIFARTVTMSPASVRKMPEFIEPWDIDPIEQDNTVKRVVFVIHGIRDEGHWTQKIASRARADYRAAGLKSRKQIAVVTSSYGYFSMLEFLLSFMRLSKIHWLIDQYVEARRMYPQAKFSFIGHSNGTYLIAQALCTYPEMKFERIAFAGSVVSSRFDWNSLLSTGQVSQILNFTATSDWVVAIFPRIADILPLSFLLGANLGGAGIIPFTEREGVESNDYKKGRHGAAIKEENWDALARFAVGKELEIPPENPEIDNTYAQKPLWLFRKYRGVCTCLIAWGFLLYTGLWHLPRLAALNPLLFWGVPLSIGIISSILISINQKGAYGKSIHRRRQVKKVSAGIIYVATAMTVILLLISFFLAPATLQTNSAEWIRSLSVVTYFIGTYLVLTKV